MKMKTITNAKFKLNLDHVSWLEKIGLISQLSASKLQPNSLIILFTVRLNDNLSKGAHF